MPKNPEKNPIGNVLKEIQRQYGEGAIMALDADAVEGVEGIPTGSISLDRAIGVGGIPQGAITEVFGLESAGKTTLALHIAANAQRKGLKVAFIDAEHVLDLHYAEHIGLQRDSAWISQPQSGEEGLQILSMLAESGEMGLVVVDSVSALVPRKETEGEIGDVHVGAQARMMSQAMRILQPMLKKTGTAVLFINQIRMKIGVMFGSPETTSGGNALRFAASVRLKIKRIAGVKQGERQIGARTKVEVVKNKVSVPRSTAEFDIIYGEGISLAGDLMDTGLSLGILKKNGNWLEMHPGPGGGAEKIANGREKARERIRSEESLQDFLWQKIQEAQTQA